MDWLQNTQKGDIGLISSKKKCLKKLVSDKGVGGGSTKHHANKNKAGGALRHPILTLKKVARLPIKDIEEVMKVLRDSKVMKVLKQKIRNRRHKRERITKSLEEVNQSSNNDSLYVASVTNDWKHWVVLKGSKEASEKDIHDIGETISVSFKSNNFNKFSVLTRPKQGDLEPVLTSVVGEGDVVEGGA